MASVFKPKGKPVQHQVHRRERPPPQEGRGDGQGGYPADRNDLENRVALRREGLIDPAAESYSAHAARPLAGHLDDFRKALEDKNGEPQTRQGHGEPGRAAYSPWPTPSGSPTCHSPRRRGPRRPPDKEGSCRDGQPSRPGGQGVPPLALAGRPGPGARLGPPEDEQLRSRPPRRRRALHPDEAGRLVQAAESGPDVMGMTGPDRPAATPWRSGPGSGRAELASLTPERFDLDRRAPDRDVPAGYTKNGQEAVQPLPPALAEAGSPLARHAAPGPPRLQPARPDGRDDPGGPGRRRHPVRDPLGGLRLP